MSDLNDEIEFDGGILDEAGINANDIPDDPFGFGNDFWPVYVTEAPVAKVTANKDKIGWMVKFAVDHPKFQGSYVSKGLGNGMWMQLPVPLALRSQIPWDPEGEKEQRALFQLKELYKALGFPKDQFGKIKGTDLVNRRALTKIKAKMGDSGFWEFSLNGMKPIGDGNGADEFTQQGTSNPGKSAKELLEDELNEA